MKICHNYISLILLVIPVFILGCKDGPLSSSSDSVDVSGKVLYQNESGDLIPVSNALISAVGYTTSANSNSVGEYVITDIKPGDVTFVVTHEDYFELEVPLEIKKSGNDSVDLIFPTDMLDISVDNVDVSGKVLYQNESGVLIPVSNAGISIIGYTTSANSNADGEYILRDIRPGNVTFVVTHEDYFELEIPMEIKKSGNDSVDLVLPSDMLSTSIHGVVYDSRHPPRYDIYSGLYFYTVVPGVRVFIDGEERAVTDSTGRFEIDRIRSNSVIEITFMKSSWEAVTGEFDTSRDTNWHFPFEQSLTPILEEYYTFKNGSFWIFNYYSYNMPTDISRVGEYTWEVVDIHNDNEGDWYELRTELVYEDFQSRNPSDSTYIESGTSITTLRVRQDGWRYRVTNDNGFVLYNLTKDFITGSPDEVTEKTENTSHPYQSRYWHKVYQRGVGLVFREYKSIGGGMDYTERWDLTDSGTR
jgi:hypothetical protein